MWCWTAAARWPYRLPPCSSSQGCLSSTCYPGASNTGSSRCPPTQLTRLPCYSCSSCLTSCRRPSPSRLDLTQNLVLSHWVPKVVPANSFLTRCVFAAHQPTGCEARVCVKNFPFQVSEVFGGNAWILPTFTSCCLRCFFFKSTVLLHYNSALLVLPHQLKRIPPHCLEGLRGVYSQLEVFTCSKSLSSLEVLSAGSTSRFLGMWEDQKAQWFIWCAFLGAALSVWRWSELSATMAWTSHPELQLQLHSLPWPVAGETSKYTNVSLLIHKHLLFLFNFNFFKSYRVYWMSWNLWI